MSQRLLSLLCLLPWLASPLALAEPVPLFANPVYDRNFPDPFVLPAAGGYWAYATNGNGHQVQLAYSCDLVRWEARPDALPTLPAWAASGHTWAPEVLPVAGRYLMYYTARDRATQRQCVGVAEADAPQGPFRDDRDGPLVCQPDEGGSIDASAVRAADGSLYLYWKNDGNAVGQPTWLYGQRLGADGKTRVGRPQRLLRNDTAWEGRLIEAPTVFAADGRYYLLYSANDYAGSRYAVGYAVADQPLGPYTKAAGQPILASEGEVSGPGHQSVAVDAEGRHWLFYHAWTQGLEGDPRGRRSLRVDPLRFDGARLQRVHTSLAPQPAPAVPSDSNCPASAPPAWVTSSPSDVGAP
ncbi:glycoside hydrolase [Caldimonas brevitalea]|uniref:Glycoside hydrolase n=1 Tax=Caldimonas brevitalea TaxID=413882 RepID=A0A0G3BZ01_9BURK|nr:glycoside hydrolase [Caldimonas brevitalea]